MATSSYIQDFETKLKEAFAQEIDRVMGEEIDAAKERLEQRLTEVAGRMSTRISKFTKVYEMTDHLVVELHIKKEE